MSKPVNTGYTVHRNRRLIGALIAVWAPVYLFTLAVVLMQTDPLWFAALLVELVGLVVGVWLAQPLPVVIAQARDGRAGIVAGKTDREASEQAVQLGLLDREMLAQLEAPGDTVSQFPYYAAIRIDQHQTRGEGRLAGAMRRPRGRLGVSLTAILLAAWTVINLGLSIGTLQPVAWVAVWAPTAVYWWRAWTGLRAWSRGERNPRIVWLGLSVLSFGAALALMRYFGEWGLVPFALTIYAGLRAWPRP